MRSPERSVAQVVAPGGTQVVPPGASRTAAEKYHPPERADTLSCAAFAPRDSSVLEFSQVLRGRCRLLALAVLDRSAVCAVLSYSCYGIVYLSGSCVFRAAPLLKLKVCSSSGSHFRRCRCSAQALYLNCSRLDEIDQRNEIQLFREN